MTNQFQISPHEPMVIMEGHSQIGRVYKHDGVRREERCKEIRDLWLAAPDMAEALKPFADFFDFLLLDTEGFQDEDEFELMFGDHTMQTFKVSDFRSAHAALSKARGEA